MERLTIEIGDGGRKEEAGEEQTSRADLYEATHPSVYLQPRVRGTPAAGER